MRKLVLALFFILLIYKVDTYAQDSSLSKKDSIDGMFNNIPRKTNTITLTVANAEGLELLKKIKLALADKNIFPSSVDTDLGLINTQEVPTKTGVAKYSIRVVKVDSVMQVRVVGYFKSGMEINFGYVTATNEWSRITKKGMGGSIYLENFNLMANMAKSLATDLSITSVKFIDDTQSTKSERRKSDKCLDSIYN